jgi:hypothetical protein
MRQRTAFPSSAAAATTNNEVDKQHNDAGEQGTIILRINKRKNSISSLCFWILTTLVGIAFIVAVLSRHHRLGWFYTTTTTVATSTTTTHHHNIIPEAAAAAATAAAAAAKENSPFLLPQLKPGEMSPIFWRSDRKMADPHGRLVGLPRRLTDDIRAFCEEVGLMEHFRALVTTDPVVPQGTSRLLDLKGNRKWTATSPDQSAHWNKCNLHWVDAADEENFEEALALLKRGGFGKILDAIGSEFQSDGLTIVGMGFIVVSHCVAPGLHRDNPGGGKDFLDLLFPLILPENDVAQLYIGDCDDEKRRGLVDFQPDVAILLGMDTLHGTANCDYRQTEGLRVAVSVYVVDVNEDNVELISDDGTALFPVPGMEEWLLAQKGRQWTKEKGLVKDQGRKPFSVEDDDDDCPEWAQEGKCETDLWGVRMNCLKSCNIYIDDERYFSQFVDVSEEAVWR